VPESQDPEFIIGGTELDQTVWETSRRYLVALTLTRDDGSPFHTCTATLISRRVVLSAARELVDTFSITMSICFIFVFGPR